MSTGKALSMWWTTEMSWTWTLPGCPVSAAAVPAATPKAAMTMSVASLRRIILDSLVAMVVAHVTKDKAADAPAAWNLTPHDPSCTRTGAFAVGHDRRPAATVDRGHGAFVVLGASCADLVRG